MPEQPGQPAGVDEHRRLVLPDPTLAHLGGQPTQGLGRVHGVQEYPSNRAAAKRALRAGLGQLPVAGPDLVPAHPEVSGADRRPSAEAIEATRTGVSGRPDVDADHPLGPRRATRPGHRPPAADRHHDVAHRRQLGFDLDRTVDVAACTESDSSRQGGRSPPLPRCLRAGRHRLHRGIQFGVARSPTHSTPAPISASRARFPATSSAGPRPARGRSRAPAAGRRPRWCGRGCSGPRPLVTNTVAPLSRRPRAEVLEFADLVAAAAQPGQVVTLDPTRLGVQTEPAAQPRRPL